MIHLSPVRWRSYCSLFGVKADGDFSFEKGNLMLHLEGWNHWYWGDLFHHFSLLPLSSYWVQASLPTLQGAGIQSTSNTHISGRILLGICPKWAVFQIFVAISSWRLHPIWIKFLFFVCFCFVLGLLIIHRIELNAFYLGHFGLYIFLDFASGFKWMILSSSCLDIEWEWYMSIECWKDVVLRGASKFIWSKSLQI